MIAVIHQAYFLPWLGYFNKLAYADNLVILDNVQYRKRYYHNRTNIKNMHGEKCWLTLPVGKNYKSDFREVGAVNRHAVLDAYATVQHSYVRTQHFSSCWPPIVAAIEKGYPRLLDININAIKAILELLNFNHVEITLSSNAYEGDDPTDRLIHCCKGTDSTALIMGQGGSYEYHDVDRIRDAGIDIVVQEFVDNHPRYPQIREGFIERLSAIDALFNIGRMKTAELLRDAWSPDEEFLLQHFNAYQRQA